MSDLTKEELAELAALEREEKARLDAEAVAAKRQHLEALRSAKRLSAKHGMPGRDFVVLETKVGNIAVRKPMDIEIDAMDDENVQRGKLEELATALTIEPLAATLQPLFADNPGLAPAIMRHAIKLAKVEREEASKK